MTERSLTGRRVVVTAPAASRLADGLRARGAEVIECPTIAIAPPSTWEPLDNAIKDVVLKKYDWVLFASKNGVVSFFERRKQLGGRAHGPLDSFAQVGAVGTATAEQLKEEGVAVSLTPEHFTSRALADALGSRAGRVVAIRVEDGPRHAIDALRAAGWTVDDIGAYRTVPGSPDASAVAAIQAGSFDAVTFTSGSTATNFVALVGAPDALGLGPDGSGPVVACIGPETASVARSADFRVDVIADPHTSSGLIEALVDGLD